VLETAERAAMERRDRHATLAEALERLSQRWNPADFDGPPWADSWLRRAERILTQLYTHWPSGGTPVALEYRLAFEFAGARWRGKADRIEVRGGGLAIVDYKTGASPPTVDEAAESLQLGFYSMAAGADETLAALGEVTAAEMWFPAKKDQRSVPVRSLDLDRISEVEAAMELGVAGIRSEHWIATPSGACDFCAVRLVCPEWPEGREAFSQ
jgi:RecB family exonuclease